jgi:hypothetical protein
VLLTYSLEYLAAVTGIFYYKKYQDTATKYFIWFLLIVAISDTSCFYTFYVRPNEALDFLVGTKIEKNHWWVTIYWKVGAILFYTFYFYRVLKKTYFKNILKYAACIFFMFSAIYIALHWEAFFNQFFPIISVLGALIILLCAVFYFIEILISDKILDFYKSINFYISATIFVWWLIITPLSFYGAYYAYDVGKGHFDLDFASLRKQIYLFTNMFMYLTFTFAFIWCRPENE